MSLSDPQIREELLNGLKQLENDIINYELPLSQYGHDDVEIFSTTGKFGEEEGQPRHWVALILVSDNPAYVQKLHQFACEM